MLISVLEPNPNTDLTTVEAVKLELGIESGDTSKDALLQSLIASQSAAIYAYIGRPLAREAVREQLAGHGTVRLMVSRTPVVDVVEVAHRGQEGSSTGVMVEDALAGFLYRPEGWHSSPITGFVLAPVYTGQHAPDWSVTYVAGYHMPGSTDSSDAPPLPADIQQACIDLVKMAYTKSVGGGEDYNPLVASRRTGDSQVSYASPSALGITAGPGGSGGFPPDIKARLDPYVRGDLPTL